MRRKGELSPAGIRRDFPHGARFPEGYASGLLDGGRIWGERAPRTVRQLRDGQWFVLVCFREEAAARAFADHAQGEYVNLARSR
jgi:hypothetical protein